MMGRWEQGRAGSSLFPRLVSPCQGCTLISVWQSSLLLSPVGLPQVLILLPVLPAPGSLPLLAREV